VLLFSFLAFLSFLSFPFLSFPYFLGFVAMTFPSFSDGETTIICQDRLGTHTHTHTHTQRGRILRFVFCGLFSAGILNSKKQQLQEVRTTACFFEFSLCLFRACLGKMFVFIYKWLKNAVFRRSSLKRRR
jgi:hypothetical protein